MATSLTLEPPVGGVEAPFRLDSQILPDPPKFDKKGRIGFQTPSLLDTQTWVAAYGPDSGGYRGVLVIPRDSPEQAQAVPLPAAARFAWDAHTVAAIAGDGTGGYIFDLTSRAITSRFAVPADTDIITAR